LHVFLISCPHCGERDQSEFSHAGEAHIARPANSEEMSDNEWAQFVFGRSNPKGVHAERWLHGAGCGKYFNMLRNTASDEILAVYRIGQPRPPVSTAVPDTPSGEVLGSGNDAAKIVNEADR
jgi:sarcosine oxidase subunit delta